MAPNDLEGLLTPFQQQQFLRTCWGKNFQHVAGTPGKFAELLPWSALNRILEQHRLEPPRLRLTREGTPVTPSSYISYQPNRRRPGQSIPRLRSAGLTRQLREGATLVLDAVDELYPPVTALAESLERLFQVRIQVNAYAGWRTSHGFDLHWDDHDVFVLQIAGRKHWKVYGMTRMYPLAKDVEPTLDKPDAPLWEGLMSDGDLLYIPRGWWHVAAPLDEPTLHLTVGINNATGADFLSWFADRMRSHEDVRRDLPLFGDSFERDQLVVKLRAILSEELSAGIIDEFLADRNGKASARPHMNFPWGASPEILPDGETRVRWNGPRELELTDCGRELHVNALGRRWRFAPAARPLLEALATERSVVVSDGDRPLIRELVDAGLVVVEE